MAGQLFDARSIQNDLAGEASQGLLDGSVVVPLPPVSVHNVVLKTPKIGVRHLNSLSLSLSVTQSPKKWSCTLFLSLFLFHSKIQKYVSATLFLSLSLIVAQNS